MDFKLLGATSNEETLAVGSAIREIKRLIKAYGERRWRKRKGIGRVRLSDGTTKLAELHCPRDRTKGLQDQALPCLGQYEDDQAYATCGVH